VGYAPARVVATATAPPPAPAPREHAHQPAEPVEPDSPPAVLVSRLSARPPWGAG